MRLTKHLSTLPALFLGFMVLLLVCWRPSPAAQVKDLQPPDTPIPTALFGMHILHMLVPPHTAWPAVPFGTWRLWDTYTAWPSLEATKGRWNFSELDKYMDLAEQHHVHVLLTLGLTPQWASTRPDERSNYGLGNAAVPRDLNEWGEYIRTVAERYKGRIHEYEIWNEPNVTTGYSGSIPDMVQLAEVAYRTLKQVDPTIMVCTPSATRTSGLDWLDQYLKAGGGKYADAIGFHFYVDPETPERMIPLFDQVEHIMRENGVGNKPLWDTETGYLIQNKQSIVKAPPHSPYLVLSEDQAVSYLARSYILAWAGGVSRLYWYAWDNWNEGLVDRDGKTLKAPAIAYGQMENWLVGATMTFCGSDAAGIWTCAITRPGNYRAWIVWDPDRTVSFPVPALWKVNEIRDLSGGTRALGKVKTVEIGPSPLLLVASGS